jgi:hypothetical protein
MARQSEHPDLCFAMCESRGVRATGYCFRGRSERSSWFGSGGPALGFEAISGCDR